MKKRGDSGTTGTFLLLLTRPDGRCRACKTTAVTAGKSLSLCPGEVAFPGQDLWSAGDEQWGSRGMVGVGRINPNSPGSGERRKAGGSTAQLRMEKLLKNSAPGAGKMLTQLLFFGAAKPQETGLAAGFERGRGREICKPAPVSLSSPL